jgi:2-keto-4-pentenoate hydratase
MTPTEIATAAAAIAGARRARSRIGALPETCRPATATDAHAIQDAVTALLDAEVGAFKANAPIGDAPGVRAPIYAPAILASPARIDPTDCPQCGVEGEIAFRFRQDLPPRPTPYTREEVAASVDACAAIEPVTSRFADPAAPALDKLADCLSNGGFVYGAIIEDWHRLDLAKLQVTLTVNGETVLDQVGGHPTNDPLGAAVALVELMRRAGGVKAGQYVTTGSCTGLRYLAPGDRCGVVFEGLGAAQLEFVAPHR